MIKFHAVDENPFDYVVKIVFKNDSFDTKILYQRTENIPEALKNIGIFCFPYKNFQIKQQITFTSSFTDSSKNIIYYYVAQTKSVAVSVVSRFYHPKFYETVSKLFVGISDIQAPDILLQFSDINHQKYDWTIGTKNNFFTNLSPANELCRLYSFLFAKLPIRSILATIVAMMLDCRIIIISSDLSNLSDAAFSFLALIYPLSWPLTFIPILPQSLLATLEAPFGYLIGVHSSFSQNLLEIDRYFVVNIDAHYTAVVGMENFPERIVDFITERSDKLESILNQYSPIFPFIQIQKEIRSFIKDIFGVTFSIENTENIREIITQFNQWKTIPSEEFNALFSQTQFVNTLIDAIEFEPVEEIFHAFWPNNVFIKKTDVNASNNSPVKQASSTPALVFNRRMSPVQFGLASNRKNSINKSQLSLGLDEILLMKDDSDGMLEDVIRQQKMNAKKEKTTETADDSTTQMNVLTKKSSGPFYYGLSSSSGEPSDNDEPSRKKKQIKRRETTSQFEPPKLIESNEPAVNTSSLPLFNATTDTDSKTSQRQFNTIDQEEIQAASSELSSQDSLVPFSNLAKSTNKVKKTVCISTENTVKDSHETQENIEDDLDLDHHKRRHSRKPRKRKSKAKSQYNTYDPTNIQSPSEFNEDEIEPLQAPKGLLPPIPLSNIRKPLPVHYSPRPFARTPMNKINEDQNTEFPHESYDSKPPMIIRQRALYNVSMPQRRRFSKPNVHQPLVPNCNDKSNTADQSQNRINLVFDYSESYNSSEENATKQPKSDSKDAANLSKNNEVKQSKSDSKDDDNTSEENEINQSKEESKDDKNSEASDDFVVTLPQIKNNKSNPEITLQIKPKAGILSTRPRNNVTPTLNRNMRNSVMRNRKFPSISIVLSSSSSESEDN